jgi:hypothetical protein
MGAAVRESAGDTRMTNPVTNRIYDEAHAKRARDFQDTQRQAESDCRANRPTTIQALQTAYLALLASSDRVHHQYALCACRDAIARDAGRSPQDVQDEFEAKANLGHNA